MNTVSEKAKIGNNCDIGEFTIVHDDVIIGDNVKIGANCVIGLPTNGNNEKLFIGDDSLIRSHTILYQGSYFEKKLETGHHVLIRENTKAGINLRVGSFSDIEGDVEIGDYTRFHSYVHIGKGSLIGSFVWIYSLVILTNDPLPPSNAFTPVHIEDGVVVCVNSIIQPGIKLQKGSFIPAGSNVNRDLSIGEVFQNNNNNLISVNKLVSLKNNIRHPWMIHFKNAYPEEAWEKIEKLKEEILLNIKKRK